MFQGGLFGSVSFHPLTRHRNERDGTKMQGRVQQITRDEKGTMTYRALPIPELIAVPFTIVAPFEWNYLILSSVVFGVVAAVSALFQARDRLVIRDDGLLFMKGQGSNPSSKS